MMPQESDAGDMFRRWLATAALLWTGCAAVYFLTAPGRIDMIDGGIRYEVANSLLETGRPIVCDPWCRRRGRPTASAIRTIRSRPRWWACRS